jgi:pyrroloquinoline quinone biosynthesis protein D
MRLKRRIQMMNDLSDRMEAGPDASTLPAKPALNPHFRMQWEPSQQCHVLLYPEGMVRLNGSAGAILGSCKGVSTVDEIVASLEKQYGASGLRSDIVAMLRHAYEENWIV